MRETEEKRRERRGDSNLLQGASFNEEQILRTNGKRDETGRDEERKDYSVRETRSREITAIGEGRTTDGAPR